MLSALSNRACSLYNTDTPNRIGAGTGIFTRALLSHPEWTTSVGEYRAVEPSEGMRETFDNTVKDSRVTCMDGTFAATGADDHWADVIIIAQAFHWCPDYDAASAEFARVLKPDGIVAFIWNLEDRDAAGWVAQLRDTIEANEKGTPQFRLGLWRAAFDTTSYKAHFSPPEEKQWSYNLQGTLEIVQTRALSKSYIAVMSDEAKDKLKHDIQKIIEKGDDLNWKDEAHTEFDYPYKTYLVLSRLQT